MWCLKGAVLWWDAMTSSSKLCNKWSHSCSVNSAAFEETAREGQEEHRCNRFHQTIQESKWHFPICQSRKLIATYVEQEHGGGAEHSRRTRMPAARYHAQPAAGNTLSLSDQERAKRSRSAPSEAIATFLPFPATATRPGLDRQLKSKFSTSFDKV